MTAALAGSQVRLYGTLDLVGVEIGGAMVVESRGDHVVVARGGGTAMAQQCQPVELVINGAEAVWGEWRLRATRGSWPGPSEDRLREWVDEDALRGALTVRSRREGDRFWPFGNEGHKKLKEFQRERGLARAERDSAPLVVSDHEIAWVVGERIGHPFRVRQGTTRAVLLEARRESH